MPTNRPANRTYNKPLTTPALRAAARKAFKAADAAEQAAKETAVRDAEIAQIAFRLGFETLETLNSDSADFREVAVWSIKAALEAAYAAGKAAK